MTRVLITGFDPFGGETVNPSLEAVKKISDNIAGAEVIKVEIPTVFKKSIEKLSEYIEQYTPDIVICVGQAGGRFDITPERVAINLNDARMTDNEGYSPRDTKTFEDGENAYFTNLPVKAMVQEMKDNGIPASLSTTAGTYVCNHLMYGVLYLVDKKYPNMKGGFIHVPFTTSQVVSKPNMPSLSIDDIVKGLECCIKAAVENNEDLDIAGGSIC